MTSNVATQPTSLPANAELDANRWTTPYCFIADTDSIPYIVDSGANRVILNNAKLFKSFKAQRGAVKGVGGNPVSIIGTGTLEQSLQSDEGIVDKIEIDNAVYVPSSPYNLIPPQLLINQLKRVHYDVEHAKHDDRKYIFTYRPTSDKSKKPRTLTVPIGANNLFTFRSNDGYSAFLGQSQQYGTDWCTFPGAHVIPDSDDDASHVNPREADPTQACDKPREPDHRHTHENMRETSVPHSVPYDDDDFESIRDSPIEARFDLESTHEHTDKINTVIYKRKQQRLSTIHERLGHLSFGNLKLLARAGIGI
jgi:hypothetical protein